MWEVGPILSSSTECFSVTYIRISSFDALDLVLNESIVCRGDSLSLLWRSVDNGWPRKLMISHSSNRNAKIIHIGLIDQEVWSWVWDLIQEIMRRREETVTQVKLISRWQKQPTHVDREQIGAVTTSNSNSLE